MSSPTASISNPASVESLLESVTDLQEEEHRLLIRLSNATGPEEAKRYVTNINQFANMRKNLYTAIAQHNDTTLQNVESNLAAIEQQRNAIAVMEKQLNDLKTQYEALQDNEHSQVRLVQINTYFAERYQAHTQLLKILLYTLVPLVILAYLRNLQWLQGIFFYLPFILVSMVGAFYFWNQLQSIWSRNNMVYSEFDWKHDPDLVLPANAAKYPSSTSSTSSTSPSSSSGSCTNNQCCSTGTLWDPTKYQCMPIPGTIPVPRTASTTPPTPTSTPSTLTASSTTPPSASSCTTTTTTSSPSSSSTPTTSTTTTA